MGGEAFLSILNDLDEQVTSCIIGLTTHFADMAPTTGRRDHDFPAHSLDPISCLVLFSGKKDPDHLLCAVAAVHDQASQLWHLDWSLDLPPPVSHIYSTLHQLPCQ